MGNCIGRQRHNKHVKRRRRYQNAHQRSMVAATLDSSFDEPYMLIIREEGGRHQSSSSGASFQRNRTQTDNSWQPGFICRKVEDSDIDKHVLETLAILRTSAEDDAALLSRMKTFRSWANSETGWKMVLSSLIRTIPNDEPLGPSAITLFIDHCPLPSKNAVTTFIQELNLSNGENDMPGEKSLKKHRNICAVLGHLAESLSAPFSKMILTDEVLNFLLGALDVEKCVTNVAAMNTLFSLIALEKISLIKENKDKILKTDILDRLQLLESFHDFEESRKRQVGFLAQWLLDNVFMCDSRPYSYETIDLSNINVMLNDKDVSEYLKISPDGLEARSDAPSFESVRCTFSVDQGVWFYEVTVVTSGVMQIGWASKNSKFLNHDGFGVGDDKFSYSYDGCRQLLWYQAQSRSHSHPSWKEGDTLGLLLDIDNYEVIFYLNGDALPPQRCLFNRIQSGFFAAASFMSFQQCRFNFGSESFKYPPLDKNFSTFNNSAILDPADKIIYPKHKKIEKLRQVSISEGSCTICCDSKANTVIKPCGHSGICKECGTQLSQCHLCRTPINDLMVVTELE